MKTDIGRGESTQAGDLKDFHASCFADEKIATGARSGACCELLGRTLSLCNDPEFNVDIHYQGQTFIKGRGYNNAICDTKKRNLALLCVSSTRTHLILYHVHHRHAYQQQKSVRSSRTTSHKRAPQLIIIHQHPPKKGGGSGVWMMMRRRSCSDSELW